MRQRYDPLHNHPSVKHHRKALRATMTPAEKRMWTALRRRQIGGKKFRRQHSIGPFIVDFFCMEERLAIEIDGSVHDDPLRAAYDVERQQFLEAHGIRVVRFSNEQIRDSLDEVLDVIREHIDQQG
jgi:very-short-patch-repair endonuclease